MKIPLSLFRWPSGYRLCWRLQSHFAATSMLFKVGFQHASPRYSFQKEMPDYLRQDMTKPSFRGKYENLFSLQTVFRYLTYNCAMFHDDLSFLNGEKLIQLHSCFHYLLCTFSVSPELVPTPTAKTTLFIHDRILKHCF